MTKNSIDIHIGQKLRETRIVRKMSQEQVGELIGVSLQQVQKYEICANRISASKLYEFTKIFNVSISSFFEDCVTDRDLETTQPELEEIDNLVFSFNKINDTQIRADIVKLVNSISNTKL
jgi:transcriptional regulator with XRE-family HTH domain